MGEIKLDPRADWRLGAQFIARAAMLSHPYHVAAKALKIFMENPGQRAIITTGPTWPTALAYDVALKACSTLCRLGLEVQVVIGEDRKDDIFLGLELVDVPQLSPDAFRALSLQPLPTDKPNPESSKHAVNLMLYDDELPDYLAEVARERGVWRPRKR
jgi:hypothetical protein